MYANDLYEADLSYRIYMEERQMKLDQRKSNSSVTSEQSMPKKMFTLQRFREVKAAMTDTRPQTAPPVLGNTQGICGYTGHRPRKSVPHIDRPTVEIKMCGYTGHIPNSFEEQKVLKCMARNPVCKYKQLPKVKHTFTPQQKENTKARYERNFAILEKQGQTAMGVLAIVQNKLQERVNSSAQQHIRISRMFEYFDSDCSRTLEETEFRSFLEYCTVFLNEVQFLALFALFDADHSSGLSWSEFSKYAMVNNPKGGTAILPKAITRAYSSDGKVHTPGKISSAK
jgi:Ca2+-binding EF-hand superfamily protein